ncbi:MAG: CerR family C-terminal domain-containing protein [Pseudomonadota bacterium]
MKSGLDVKNRILEEAGEIFADRGFKETTVREICRRAGVNLAAVNYHFGDKERLYMAVIKHYKEIAVQKYTQNDLMHDHDPYNVQLAAFIESFMFHLLGEGHASCFSRLMSREYIDPTSALDVIIEEEFRPFFNRLNAIVRQLLGKEIGEEKVILCSMSVLGQCLYFRSSRPVIIRLLRKDHYSAQEIKEISDHITCFSLKALAGLSKYS